MIKITQVKSLFCACLVKNLRQFLGRFISIFIIFLIVCNASKSERIDKNLKNVLDSFTILNKSMNTNQNQQKRDESLQGHFNPEILDSTIQSTSKRASKTIPKMMLQQNRNSYVMLSPVHSSAFHNLIDSLSHHLFKKPENNIKDNKFAQDDTANQKTSFNSTINTLKPEKNLSVSVPYFDMLYELSLDVNPVYTERPGNHSCRASNNSVSNHGLSSSNDESSFEKP